MGKNLLPTNCVQIKRPYDTMHNTIDGLLIAKTGWYGNIFENLTLWTAHYLFNSWHIYTITAKYLLRTFKMLIYLRLMPIGKLYASVQYPVDCAKNLFGKNANTIVFLGATLCRKTLTAPGLLASSARTWAQPLTSYEPYIRAIRPASTYTLHGHPSRHLAGNVTIGGQQ